MAVLLDESMIRSLAGRPEVVREFPVLQATKAQQACCGKPSRVIDYNAIKTAFAAMPADRKARLKEFLNTDSVRMVYHLGGKVEEHTF